MVSSRSWADAWPPRAGLGQLGFQLVGVELGQQLSLADACFSTTATRFINPPSSAAMVALASG